MSPKGLLAHRGSGGELLLAASEIASGQDALLWELRTASALARLHKAQGRHAKKRPVYDPYTKDSIPGFPGGQI